ncbi:MAG: peptidoglycan bridge formation glycyltransferase FemA/FemB family protein [bacterium]|nr:peptidoglycan bridge formation glycyltransferase FemA/FemB family protein [bacterium]
MTNFELREMRGEEHFDPNTLCDNAPFTQASFYGNWQKNLGRTVKRFLVYSDKKIVAYFQLIKYPLLFGKSYCYIPYGPVTKDFSEDFFVNLKQELKQIAKGENSVFVRLDFTPLALSGTLSKFFSKAPLYTYHSAYFQPRAEWFLELKKSENELLLAMHEKTRYSIRLAERKEITTEIVTENFEKYVEIFYELMRETAKRNGFSLHQKEYYESIFQNLSKIENSYLSVAKYKEKILCIYLVVMYGKVANYLYGGSSTEERNRMPTYLTHWKAICYAKELNCDYYNFGGIEEENNLLNKGMISLTAFKKKFGGKEIIHSDFFDVVVNPFWYHLYNFRKYLKKTRT